MTSTTEPRERRQYTQKERDEILASAEEVGVVEAARRHDVPQTTLSNWRNRDSAKLAQPGKALPEKAEATIASKASAKPTGTTPKANESNASPPPPPITAPKPSATAPNVSSSKRVARSYTPSEKAEILEHAAAHGVLAASTKFNASRFSIYEWKRKVEKAAKGEGPSPTSGPSSGEIEKQRDREILGEWSKHPGLGPSQIRNQLRRHGIKVSVHTTRRVMEDAGYRPPKVERTPHDQRFEAVRPNHLWHLDFVHRHINRASTFTLILIDDQSRFVPGHGVDDAERADMVVRTFEEAVERHGKPERVMHDRGAAFWSWRGISRFTSLLTEMGIDQVVAVDKEHNGKVEVFNANLHKELFDRHRFISARS